MTSITGLQGQSGFSVQIGCFLKRIGAVTAGALLVIAVVLSFSAASDPSLGRHEEPQQIRSTAI